MPILPGAVPAGQTLKKLTASKTMEYVLFLIKANLCTQWKFLSSKKFEIYTS